MSYFFLSVVFGNLGLLNTIWVFWVELFLICLWLPRLEIFLKSSYSEPKVETRCSYKIVLIRKKRVYQSSLAISQKDPEEHADQCRHVFELLNNFSITVSNYVRDQPTLAIIKIETHSPANKYGPDFWFWGSEDKILRIYPISQA